MHPEEIPTDTLNPGQVGYIACNMKQSSEGISLFHALLDLMTFICYVDNSTYRRHHPSGRRNCGTNGRFSAYKSHGSFYFIFTSLLFQMMHLGLCRDISHWQQWLSETRGIDQQSENPFAALRTALLTWITCSLPLQIEVSQFNESPQALWGRDAD